MWFWKGERLDTTGNSKYRNMGRKKRLQLKWLAHEDSGIYECAMVSNTTKKAQAELWSKLPMQLHNGFSLLATMQRFAG